MACGHCRKPKTELDCINARKQVESLTDVVERCRDVVSILMDQLDTDTQPNNLKKTIHLAEYLLSQYVKELEQAKADELRIVNAFEDNQRMCDIRTM